MYTTMQQTINKLSYSFVYFASEIALRKALIEAREQKNKR